MSEFFPYAWGYAEVPNETIGVLETFFPYAWGYADLSRGAGLGKCVLPLRLGICLRQRHLGSLGEFLSLHLGICLSWTRQLAGSSGSFPASGDMPPSAVQ